MASSNRHWPSMFKSKPCNTHHQWQHDINSSLTSNSCQRTPYTSVQGCEERSPEPKPRWNPKPEQIRILEAIFNSGMVNPPRDEIRKIRAQLQEYGQVGDANVFYWFQNRKSRSKHKQRHLQTLKPRALANSSSSSSEKSPPTLDEPLALGGGGGGGRRNVIDVISSNSPTELLNQAYFPTNGDFPQEPFLFQVQHPGGGAISSQGYCFPEISGMVQLSEPGLVPCHLLLGDMVGGQESSKKEVEEKMKMQEQQQHYVATSAISPTTATSSPTSEMQGVGETGVGVAPAGAARSTVFINGVAFEVAVGPINVRQAFGEEAVLIHSSGQPVLTNEWGVTLHALQHGASYYLV